MSKKDKTTLFVTRAQPCHGGHLSALYQAVEAGAKEIIIAIGSANAERTQSNPFTSTERAKLMDALIRVFSRRYPNIPIHHYPIMDFGDEKLWKTYIEKTVPYFDSIIGQNATVNKIFSDKESIPSTSNDVPYRGTHIRHQIGQGNRDTVKESVPGEVFDVLQEIDADKIIQQINKIHPAPVTLASDLIIKHNSKYILIRRKYAPYGIALPGGKLDPGETLVNCAQREGLEELFSPTDSNKSLQITTDQPFRVNDDPHRDPRGRVIAFAYEAEILGGKLQGNDDAAEIIYISPAELETMDVSQFAFPDHYETLLAHSKMRDK